jgi:hypothetical protein
MNDGALRCFASQILNDKIWVFPYNGRGLVLFDPVLSEWRYTQIVGNVTELDKNDCDVSGAQHQALVTGTNYWIYAYRKPDGTVGYEFHPAGGALDAGSGYIVKPNDITRRLIGGCNFQPNGVGFGLGAQSNNVGSYFNRLEPVLRAVVTGGSAGGTWTAVTTPQSRISLWAWGDSFEPLVIASGSMSGTQAGVACYAGIRHNADAEPTRKVAHTPAVDHQCGGFNVMEANCANYEGVHTYDLMLRRESFGSGSVYINPEAQICVRYCG